MQLFLKHSLFCVNFAAFFTILPEDDKEYSF